MPDISKFSPDKPFNPQIFSTVNLSDVFIPSVTMPDVNKPSHVGEGEGGDSAWSFLLKKTGRNPFSGLGIVPAGPAAVDDYYSNRKFTSEADSYQSGSTYKDLGFLIGRDNEDLFAQHRSLWDESFNTAIRLLDKVGAYTVQGFGFLGGLVGLGNKNQNYSSGSGFADWIAGASDNALSTWAKGIADDVDNYYRPIYQDAADKDKGFFRRMLTDPEFWKGDAVDGIAFLGSAYLTGNVGKILDLGGKAVRGAAALRGLNFVDNAAAFSEEGLSGLSEVTNLSKGATATEAGAALAPNTFSPNAGTVYSRFLNEAGNFANARKINMGVSTLINTASESMFEATNLKDDITARLSSEKNPDGSFKYSPEEVRNIAARGARNSFLLNMIVLPLSNLWETKMFYGKANPLSGRNAASPLIRREAGLLSTAEIAKRTFGEKGVSYLKNVGEGIFKEGLWEENIQLAIERMNKSEENIDDGFFSNIGKVLNQYVSQTAAAITGNDTETSMNIGLGGLIGGGMGLHGHFRDMKDVKKDVANYNAAINAFRTTAKDLYEKNEDGSVRLDENKKPIINTTNVLSYISSLNKTLNISELADNLKEKHMDVLHSIVDNENISRLVKAYSDNGMVDSLISKIDDIKGYKNEDLMLLGLNPDKAEATPRLEYIKKKAVEYKNIYDNIEKNFFVRMRSDDKYGTKARLMKDKLYYLSTRASNLNELKNTVDTQKLQSSSEIAVRYNSSSDGVVDRLNDLYTSYASAKKRVDYLSLQQRQLENRAIDVSGEENIKVREGVTITQKRKRKAVPKEQFTGVDEQELSDAVSVLTSAEKDMKDFLEENKENIKNIQKNADGTFRYEIPEKNRLMYDEDVVKNNNISKELEMARNATLNVFNRISDIKYGERYFDSIYSKRKQDLQDQIVNDDSEEVDENLSDEPTPTPGEGGPAIPGTEESSNIPKFQSKEDWDEGVDDLNELKREKENLEGKEDSTLEDEVRLDAVNKEIDDLEKQIKDIEEVTTDYTIRDSPNIPDVFKEDYKRILNEIAVNKRRVVKQDGYYLIDGEKYGKVSDLIGNVVPEELRAGLQNALAAGYTVDSVVKAFFDGNMNEAFKTEVATKISEEAYNRLHKQLQVIQSKLYNDGINIVASNVVVFDPVLKVAGEIDLLGVDKNGNFKIYEVEARQGRIWAQIATKSGRGPAIYEMTQKQLSAYRNLFANQYGAIPNNISVMFPIDVKYDKENPSGFIEKVNLKPEIRYTPTANVQIKSNVFQPVRIGSKYDGFDMTSLYINSFIPQAMDIAKEKLRFLLRNETFDKIKKGVEITVKEAEQKFQDAYTNQQKVIAGEQVNGYKITPIPNAPNLYALKGNKEISIIYNGQLLGFMQPSPTLVYKDDAGKYHILDENTNIETYKTVTGNSEQTYVEFANISKAYKTAYSELVNKLQSNELGYNGGEFKVLKVKNYTNIEDNKYKPGQQLKFNQGENFQSVRIIGNEDLIELIGIGSKLKKQLNGDKVSINESRKKELENKFRITALEANTKARELAKENRDISIEKIIEIGNSTSEVNISNSDVQNMFDIQMSYGDLDLVSVGESRPLLKDLVINGVKVGSKSVITVVNLDENDAVRIIMDKNTRTKNTGKKFYELDTWANKNIEQIKKILNNKRDEKVTDYAAIVETPDGRYHALALRMNKDAKLTGNEEYVTDLGNKFTSSTSKNVFKNESVSLIPKKSSTEVNIKLKGENIISDIYVAEDINNLEKLGLDITQVESSLPIDTVINDFVKELGETDFKKINAMFAAYELSNEELQSEILDDFNSGNWSSVNEYLENLKCDL